MSETTDGRIPPTGLSREVGLLSLAGVIALVVAAVVGSVPIEVALGAVVLGVLVWAYSVRPAVRITEETLVLRNPFSTVTLPLVAIEDARISYVLVVRSGERKDTSPALSRPRKQVTAAMRGNAEGAAGIFQDMVETRIMNDARDQRRAQGIELFTADHQAAVAATTRTWAWPEIAALAASVGAFATSVAL